MITVLGITEIMYISDCRIIGENAYSDNAELSFYLIFSIYIIILNKKYYINMKKYYIIIIGAKRRLQEIYLYYDKQYKNEESMITLIVLNVMMY